MTGWRAAALLGALAISANCRAESVDPRLYDLAIRGDATPHWQAMPKIPHLLANDSRWSLQRARSKRLRLSAGVWTASAYIVRPGHADGLAVEQPIAGRVSATAAGADLTLRVADDFLLLTRAAALKVRSRSYFGGFRPRAMTTDRLLIGAGLDSPGNATLVFDYVRAGRGRRNIDRLFGQPQGADQSESGARLTLAGAAEDERAIGWTFTLASMRRPELQYGETVVTPTALDRRVEIGFRLRL